MRRTVFALLNLVVLSACGGDKIHVTSVPKGTSTMVLVNGRRNGSCESHNIWSGSPDSGVANFQAAEYCPSEAAVFARGNAMALRDASAIFTDNKDTVDVGTAAAYDVPVNVMILKGDLSSGQVSDRQTTATDDMTLASTLWDGGGRCGFAFSFKQQPPVDATSVPLGSLSLTGTCQGNEAAYFTFASKALGFSGPPPPGIYVFYVVLDEYIHGDTCVVGNSAIITIGQWSGHETVGHELGHTLSLQHSDEAPDIPGDNLMLFSPVESATLTAGQCFRANVNDDSMLNLIGIRTGPQRHCPDTTVSTTCPALSLRD